MSGGTNPTINYKTRTVRISHPTGFVVYGGQFGSEGKGQLAGTLAMELGADASVSAFTPNAGHTFKMGSLIALVERRLRSKTLKDYYSKLVFKAIPCSSWITPKVFITPASVFDPTRLVAEALICKLINPNLVIYVHSNSMVLCDEHRELEAQMVGGVSSTRQGTFGAMVEKMSRSEDAHTAGKWIRSWIADREVYGDMLEKAINYAVTNMGFPESHAQELREMPLTILEVDTERYKAELSHCTTVAVEGCQGYSLGVHSGIYPYTTTREANVLAVLSDCMVPVHWIKSVFHCFRTYPIRVGNVYDSEGNLVETSGPTYSKETSFEDLGREPEKTTVTQKIRRIFEFSGSAFFEAVGFNSIPQAHDVVYFSFMDYLNEDEKLKITDSEDKTPEELAETLTKRFKASGFYKGNQAVQVAKAYGPNYEDLHFAKANVVRKLKYSYTNVKEEDDNEQ